MWVELNFIYIWHICGVCEKNVRRWFLCKCLDCFNYMSYIGDLFGGTRSTWYCSQVLVQVLSRTPSASGYWLLRVYGIQAQHTVWEIGQYVIPAEFSCFDWIQCRFLKWAYLLILLFSRRTSPYNTEIEFELNTDYQDEHIQIGRSWDMAN